MTKIIGMFSRDRRPLPVPQLKKIQTSLNRFDKKCYSWSENGIFLGMDRFSSLVGNPHYFYESRYSEDMPIVISAGRIDNITELACGLDVSKSKQLVMTDHDWMLLAYNTWGEDCAERILGDWALAAWHPSEHRLFLARDHLGYTSLYYYVDQNIFAFASSLQSLLDLKLAPVEMDELYLAQVLVGWQAYQGDRTVHAPIRRLPPAHTLTVTPNTLEHHQYWHIEDIQPLILPQRQDYITAFQEIFEEAVRVRLRTDKDSSKDNLISVALSSGLDSTSVAVTAASLLHKDGRRLKAFTAIPLTNTDLYTGPHLGNEYPLANVTANYSGNIDHYPVDAAEMTVIQGIRRGLQIFNHPIHGAGSLFWLLQLGKAVTDHGCHILLTGKEGNPGFSWTGDVFSQSIATQIKMTGLYNTFKYQAKKLLPHDFVLWYRQRRHQTDVDFLSSAIHPEFARRLKLKEIFLSDPCEWADRTPIQQRYRFLNPGRSISGALHAEFFDTYNIDFRDPAADLRVIEFAFSVPDHIFIDPKTGIDRWLIREAMKNRLPDEVRLNRKRGAQSADLVPRLRACAAEVDRTLDELSHGPAAMYVNVNYMRQVWRVTQTKDTCEARLKTIGILTRGIMAGLFVNQFYE